MAPSVGNPSISSRIPSSARSQTYHHEILLKWMVYLDKAKRDTIEEKLSKLDMLSHVRMYYSVEAPATYVHLIVKHGHQGFRRNFFTHSMNSKGANIIKKCEVPRVWTKTLWYADI